MLHHDQWDAIALPLTDLVDDEQIVARLGSPDRWDAFLRRRDQELQETRGTAARMADDARDAAIRLDDPIVAELASALRKVARS